MKNHSIKTLYVIHHSHTDIGYTDLQERVIDTQVDYIHTIVGYGKEPKLDEFRWNCETLFCVEKFFAEATEEEKSEFLRMAKEKKLGLSANYLNFNDLLDSSVFDERLDKWTKFFADHDVPFQTAMFADINGVSMGYRNALIRHGIKFLYTNIHCHHGMYPMYQNQKPFIWEAKDGDRLLVWNGEHYNLGNVLGLAPKTINSYMEANYLGKSSLKDDAVENLARNLEQYLDSCEEQGYKWNFIISSVSGVFSDNAPPNTDILSNINAFNEKYGDKVRIKMVSLQELYEAIAPILMKEDLPVVHGDFTDWWGNGVGSTPYAVKHYLNARHQYHLCERLDPQIREHSPEDVRTAQDNLLLYAEHTWGHSATISNPYETMVLDLDMRKNSYASKAHEASAHMLNGIRKRAGDLLRYYNTSGKIRVCNPADAEGDYPVSFYIETMDMPDAVIKDSEGKVISCQVSAHPRGRMITFIDHFKKGEEKEYTYERAEAHIEPINTRQCYIGAERVRDIVNTYDPVTYKLPYEYETPFFKLTYEVGKGITHLIDKRSGKDLSHRQEEPWFAPIYEVTHCREEHAPYETKEQHERRMLGRNMRGTTAEKHVGVLKSVACEERGKVFTKLRFVYELPGAIHADVLFKIYETLPRIDICFELGKTIATDIESIYLPVGLDLGGELYLKKGEEAFRPGVDQIPGTCMEFYMSDDGAAQVTDTESALLATRDAPLFFMGALKHHPIRLCDGKAENNARPLYSWVMNNIWETNFKMDLSGFANFNYTLWLTDGAKPEEAMRELTDKTFDPVVWLLS